MQCPRCRQDCCTCSNCVEMTTSTGIKCCSKCYSFAERNSQAIANYKSSLSLQEQLIESVQKILKNR